jgi:hypothetical protein
MESNRIPSCQTQANSLTGNRLNVMNQYTINLIAKANKHETINSEESL